MGAGVNGDMSASVLKAFFQFMAMAGSALALVSAVGIFVTSRIVDAAKDAQYSV
jgi:hypothetical protein